MKQRFGAKRAGFCMRLMLWIAANRKKEDTARLSKIGEIFRPSGMTIVEL